LTDHRQGPHTALKFEGLVLPRRRRKPRGETIVPGVLQSEVGMDEKRRDTIFSDNLRRLFEPASVAVVGAGDDPSKLGFHVMKSLVEGGYGGRIVPVNPGRREVAGLASVPSVREHPGSLDAAIIVVPAGRVERVFEECAEKGVRGIVLITAGFKEIEDPEGALRQERLAASAERSRIPVVGPNTFGMVNRHVNLNASFTPEFSLLDPGGISLVSQSGGISHLLAFMAMEQGVRIGKVVGLGNRLNLDFATLLPYLMEDPQTRVIALYLEGLDAPRRLLEEARMWRGKKPVLAYKTGRAGTGNLASMSHTGSMAGDHAIWEGALSQAGILWTQSAQDLLDAARALDVLEPPRGPRVAVLSGQAGPGMAACDVCEEQGMEIVRFSPRTQEAINGFLPPLALRSNPVDMGPAWYDAEATEGIVRAVLKDDRVDAVLLLMMFASANREAVPRLAQGLARGGVQKPVVACLKAPSGIWDQAVERLEGAGVLVNLATPERAAHTLALMWKYGLLTDHKA